MCMSFIYIVKDTYVKRAQKKYNDNTEKLSIHKNVYNNCMHTI